jgi:putative Mg2+ transporter-C (MgtC) family protein
MHWADIATSHDAQMVLRLLIAAVLGSVIGADRERLIWAAGLRTHMLVSVGACLFMIVSAFGFSDILGAKNVILDPSRIAAQVVSGIGFLGAGSILLRGDVIRGLTTAASLWTVAAIGLAVGGGLYIEAVVATAVILIILRLVKPLEQHLQARSHTHEIRFSTEHGKMSAAALDAALGYRAKRISRYVAKANEDGRETVTITLNRLTHEDIDDIVRALQAMPHVSDVERQAAP